jgi:chromosome segregation protein
MLKALELAGFKSFADKTRFEFPPGITVVVGPNGSGKSNIVDAIKWVLGEQSAKSLRGKDMADVIFKGGGSGGRKPLNTAEATIIFDNAARDLLYDADEVHVTRRVYRSGEGEYLINGQSCRLRDIKDLFRGTGLGADAYSIIEQGKLDVLLQASARERRAIFEEAAGISRFKAKKIEAQRRLERVDQNMLRLSDIVEEVENRLRSVRSQASKAQRYKEYSERLQQLRTSVGQSDWRRLSEKLDAIQQELAEVTEALAAANSEATSAESAANDLDVELAQIAQILRSHEGEASRTREKIVSLESLVENQRTRRDDFASEAERLGRQICDMRHRTGDLVDQVRRARSESQAAAGVYDQARQSLERCQGAELAHEQMFAQVREEAATARTAYATVEGIVAELAELAREAQSRFSGAKASAERSQRQVALLEEALAQQTQFIGEIQAQEQQALVAMHEADQNADAAESVFSELQQRLNGKNTKLAELHARRGAARERAALLEDLELRQEGVSAGAQEVLTRAKNLPDSPFGDVCGLVADLIEVNVATAPLIDVALGDLAQYVVIKGDRLIEHLQHNRERFTGRVGLFPLSGAGNSVRATEQELDGRPGIIGRADLLVETPPWFLPLVRRLLGETWFVERLSHAIALRQEGVENARFVTLAGELVESDGSLIVGPPRAAVGIISRRSELRALREQVAEWDGELAQRAHEVELLKVDVTQCQEHLRLMHQNQKASHTHYAEQRALAHSARLQGEQLARQRDAVLEDVRIAQKEASAIELALATTHEQWNRERARRDALQTILGDLEQRLQALESQGRELVAASTAAEIDLAKAEERRDSLRRHLVQLEREETERGRSLQEVLHQATQCVARGEEAERVILQATSELALLYLASEAAAAQISELGRSAEQRRVQRKQVTETCQKLRTAIHRLEERRHRAELAAGEIHHERNTLAERLREDYGIDIAEVERAPSEEEQRQREEVDEEIAQLRRKLSGVGAVNLDALAEVEELEQRFGKLSSQYQDLCDAKAALERIIAKINADSRRLFAETLETIRQNFQAVFRKVFGGGRADIVLEEGVDILDAGIEIIATPPGKQSLSISLLSGGERALTAVSLMLAIFQFRPSAFCILDEVDGPLDEANIGRFLDQLKEYLAWTKFVIVTHSKKTMTAATTLYGVTMQESGVSKRVSVKFDDVSESGHIRQEALDREPAPSNEGDQAA